MTDRDALYLAGKGGAASLNHAHMDAGSFVLEFDGVRWAHDLGAQDYNSLEAKGIDLWNRAQESQRWQIFRLNNRSHNTLTIDDRFHRVDGHAEFVAFEPTGPVPLAAIDLAPVFAGQVTRAVRTFRADPVARRVIVRDELAGLAPGARVRWAMVTGAVVEPNGPSALLREKDRRLDVRILAPAGGGVFEVIPADPPKDDFNAPNPDRRMLFATFTAPSDGKLAIEVALAGAAREARTQP